MKNNILRHWYAFVLAIAVSSVSFCVAASIKTAPKDDERIQIFVGAKDCKPNELRDALLPTLDPRIEELEVTLDLEYSSTFSYVYSTVFSEMTFFILPAPFLEDDYVTNTSSFATLNEDYVARFASKSLTYLEVEGRKKGILVHRQGEETGVASVYITYEQDEDYYLFVNADAATIGALSNHAKNDAAMVTLGGFLDL